MTKKEKTALKILLQELHPNQITIGKDNVVTLKWGYFYRHGKSPEHYRDLLVKLYPEAFVVELRDDWRAWPKGSYFVVRFLRLEEYVKTKNN